MITLELKLKSAQKLGTYMSIKELSLNWTMITNASLRCISDLLKQTLEELNINCCVDIQFSKLFESKPVELRSMLKLKNVNCDRITDARIEYLRKQASHATINHEKSNSHPENLSPLDGIWEIRAKQIEMFSRCH